ncbi:MAG: cytochrome c peroxidase [Ferruginibacter sp.]
MKTWLTLIVISGVIIIAVVVTSTAGKEPDNASEKVLAWFKNESNAFAATAIDLKAAMSRISIKDSGSIKEAKKALKRSRLQYKHIAFFLEYFFPGQALICNGPPVAEAENNQEEFREPLGLQVLESLLYTDSPTLYRENMVQQADMLARTAASFAPLLNDFKTNNNELLKSLNLELIRIITLYITGYDAPQLKTGIEEAHESFSTIEIILGTCIKDHEQKDSLQYFLASGKQYLNLHADFDSFNRLFFITRYALPIERQLNKLINETAYRQNNVATVYTYSGDLFAPGALNKKAFPHTEDESDTMVANLGKQLFFETALSGNSSRSCGSCHSQGAFFTDRLPRNKTMDGSADLPRNTPGLLYSGYQYAQFWDGRAGSLEDQISDVLKSKSEMSSSVDTILKRLNNNPVYSAAFKKIWSKSPGVNFQHTAGALAAYIRTLAPFNSPFDHYMQGDRSVLSVAQQRGFNLFMGKAQCGSCHFAPLFNGLLPPDYKTTEFEVLGTPADDDLENPHPDSDQGRYAFLPFAMLKGAFKTPSVRNAATTAPYMHNGRFSTLEKVINFYDKGGGTGLGLSVPQQTLSGNPLHLDKQEKADIVAFIESLTDQK